MFGERDRVSTRRRRESRSWGQGCVIGVHIKVCTTGGWWAHRAQSAWSRARVAGRKAHAKPHCR